MRFFSPNYERPPYRPPSEAGSVLLRATRGCPWNRCTFCSMYKGMKFEKRHTEDVLQDIDTAHRLYGSGASTVFIGDSNSLVLGVETVYLKLAGRAVAGFSTVILLLLFVGSILMVSLGVIGQYIAMIYEEIKGRPPFVIEKSRNVDVQESRKT